MALRIGIILLLTLGTAHAQDDSRRALIGTWQGQVSVRKDPERTLVVKSITRQGDHWVSNIHYGTTGKGLSHLQARIEVSGGTPALTFMTSADNKAELRLLSERELLRSLKIRADASSWVSRRMRLEKASGTP